MLSALPSAVYTATADVRKFKCVAEMMCMILWNWPLSDQRNGHIVIVHRATSSTIPQRRRWELSSECVQFSSNEKSWRVNFEFWIFLLPTHDYHSYSNIIVYHFYFIVHTTPAISSRKRRENIIKCSRVKTHNDIDDTHGRGRTTTTRCPEHHSGSFPIMFETISTWNRNIAEQRKFCVCVESSENDEALSSARAVPPGQQKDFLISKTCL